MYALVCYRPHIYSTYHVSIRESQIDYGLEAQTLDDNSRIRFHHERYECQEMGWSCQDINSLGWLENGKLIYFQVMNSCSHELRILNYGTLTGTALSIYMVEVSQRRVQPSEFPWMPF